MKRISLAALLLVALPAAGALAQTSPKTQTGQTQDASPNSETRPRRISPPPVQAPPANPEERPAAEQESIEPAAPQGIVVGTKPESRPQVAGPAATERRVELAAAGSSLLSPPQVQARIAEAERLLKSRPLQIAMTSPSIELVTLAALDRTSRIHLITLYKETFLTKGSELILPSSLGMPLNVRILRANGVNTAVAVFDNEGRSLVPLVVEFPIEKRGVFREMAYYTSAHPALLSPDLSRSGRAYVHRMIDVAERLCLVEHVDHARFRQENRLALFDEIYSLFALNEPDTYRYSVSSAGAGGMVQMIPWAYSLMRQRHPGVGLTPDFVIGMRNHANALQAMLLYMQDTWNDLAGNEDVQYALSTKLATQTELLAAGYNSNAASNSVCVASFVLSAYCTSSKLATQTELLAAGYNSNAARLPLYIRRGGCKGV